MTEVTVPSRAYEARLPEAQLRDEARRLYIDFVKTLLAIPDFRNSFIDQHNSGTKTNKPINFEHNGKSYRVEIRCKDWPYDILKIAEHEVETPFPNKRLQIQIPIQGYPDKSSIICFQLETHSETLGSYPMTRDNNVAVQNAREFLGRLIEANR